MSKPANRRRLLRSALPAVSCCAMLAGCLGSVGTLPLESAHVTFANDGKASGMAGSFRSVDGKAVEGNPAGIDVKPGSRVIGYICPDTITLDGPPTVSAEFLPGKSYLLECDAHSAKITEKNE